MNDLSDFWRFQASMLIPIFIFGGITDYLGYHDAICMVVAIIGAGLGTIIYSLFLKDQSIMSWTKAVKKILPAMPHNEAERVGKCLGKLLFNRTDEGIILSQHWNPDEISGEDRKRIARQLNLIAARLHIDYFEDNGVWVHFPSKE